MKTVSVTAWLAPILALALSLIPTSSAWSQPAWPSKPLRMVYGFPPGGADPPGRLIAEQLAKVLGQPVVFDNRPGAAGMLAGGQVSKSPPDGYTLLYVTAGHALNWITQPKTMAAHPVKGFTPMSFVGNGPQVLIVQPGFPAKDFREFIAMAKANPGKFNYASSGTGGISHLTGELLASVAGIDIVHVPYQGGGPVMAGVMGGQVQIGVIGAPPSVPLIQSGKLRALAVTSKARTAPLPDVPAVAEVGYPEYDAAAWYGVLGPPGVPAAITSRISREIDSYLNTPATKVRFADLGVDVVGGPPERFVAHLNGELAKWSPIVKKAEIKVE